jgi:protein-S-isoprenylcysteine O-methyltransferase Ste14
MHYLELKIPPVAVFFLVGVAMWFIARGLPGADIAIPGSAIIGMVLIAAGGAVALSAVLRFRRHETTVHPNKPGKATAIVTTGVYRYTRNPMYLGLACVLTAWALTLGNAAALAGVPLFIAYMTRFQIRPEERTLRELFGDDYVQYTTAVRRWI